MIRVGLNAATLCEPRGGGINRHILGLLGGFKELREECEVHLFSDRPLPAFPDFAVHVSDVRPRMLWEQVSLPLQAAAVRVSVLHAQHNVGLPRISPGFARVLTLHDLYAVRDIGKTWRGTASMRASWLASKSADAVITVSEYSKAEILKRFPSWDAKVSVVHNGVEPRFRPGAASPEVLARLGLNPPYALYVGAFIERKNVPILAEALRHVKGKLTLALAGHCPRLPSGFDGLANVRRLGYVDDEDLPDLYRGALCAVVPSKEEGFGFQVLEGMACGVPVLSSDAASLPEVGGDAAAYFKPDDARELAALLDRALADAAWRRGLAESGPPRAARFSWRSAAEKTLEVYRKVARRNG